MSDLLQAMRRFWYNNEPGALKLDGHEITRPQIYIHGGPSADFACPTCQKSEWLSRVRQENLFEPHTCPTAQKCQWRCARQGDELWTPYHQDFWFGAGCDLNLNAPRALLLFQPHRKARLYERYWHHDCDFWMINFRRLLALTCQVDVVQSVDGVDWSDYDFLIFQNLADGLRFPKPPIPVVMIMYDLWLKDYQSIVDHFRPEYLLTPYPQTVKNNFCLHGAKVHFYPLHASTMFTRSNLGQKRLDLLTIGSTNGQLYGPRKQLDRQIAPLGKHFRFEFSHHHGAQRNRHAGPVEYTKGQKMVRYLNKWSEYLGSARFVAFAGFSDKRYRPLFAKYYEALGSGAVPIVPQIPDLKLLDLEPMRHYIPLSKIWKNNKTLRYILKNHQKYQRIARNAVQWHQENEKRLLFDQFESLVQEITDQHYPPRLLQ